jgi:RNA-binding protein YhbY
LRRAEPIGQRERDIATVVTVGAGGLDADIIERIRDLLAS